MTSHEDKLAMLCAMGFDTTMSEQALTACRGDIEAAVNWLTSSGGDSGGSSTTNSYPDFNTNTNSQQRQRSVTAAAAGPITTVSGSVSQYSFGSEGRSACTCMALTAALDFLTTTTTTTTPTVLSPTTVVTREFLNRMVQTGVETYTSLRRRQQNSNSADVEHLSAEQLLSSTAAPFASSALQLLGEIQQGILSSTNDHDHPLGFYSMLSACQQDSAWTCVVITKTPETVLVCLPPLSLVAQGDKDDHSNLFILMDSHPRVHLFGSLAEHAYARFHSSLADLVQASLVPLFPAVSLGADVPELMAAMYNSFDLYPLTLATAKRS